MHCATMSAVFKKWYFKILLNIIKIQIENLTKFRRIIKMIEFVTYRISQRHKFTSCLRFLFQSRLHS